MEHRGPLNGSGMGPEQGVHLLPEPKDSHKPQRLELWEIEYFFKCPVVGMCLNASEQRRVLKKAGISVKRRSDFEIHEILVSAAEKRGRLSEKVNHLLNRKFAKDVAYLSDLDEKAFMAEWTASFHSGDFAGALWAAATRPTLCIEFKKEIFGTVHMAMHGNATQTAKLRRRLAFQEKQAQEMARKAGEAVKTRKTLQKAYLRTQQNHNELETRLTTLEEENEALRRSVSFFKEGSVVTELEQTCARLTQELSDLAAQVTEKDVRTAGLMEENRRLSEGIHRQKQLSQRLQAEAHELIKTSFTQNLCDESCPAFDLCKRRVLMVGGLTKMESLYRQIIEANGGIFEYHSGYMKSGAKKLENRLRRADIVLCPVTCNSHAACSMVKNLGKKHNKPVCILASASISAVAQALSGNAGVYTSGN